MENKNNMQELNLDDLNKVPGGAVFQAGIGK